MTFCVTSNEIILVTRLRLLRAAYGMMASESVNQTSMNSSSASISMTTLLWPLHMNLPAVNVTKHIYSYASNVSESSANNRNSTTFGLWSLCWSKTVTVSIFTVLILVTVIGNTLVILSVLTTRRLRTVTNCFVMNLAITDWLVGTCVMPPSVIYFIFGNWRFGWILCDIWISLDVLLCTASILSLCAISLDRYLAVTQPLTYSKKRRSKRLALFMILIVWITALSITCPPFFGWYEAERIKNDYVECRYNQNKGYVVFSAMGSFFIPLGVMVYVYLKIGLVLTSRRQRMARDAVSERSQGNDNECDQFMSESEHFQCNPTPKWPKLKNCKSKSVDSDIEEHTTYYELVKVSRLSTMMRCSTISCSHCATIPIQSIHFTEDRTYSESCLSKIKMECSNTNSKHQHSDCQHHNHSHQHYQPHHLHHPSHRVPMRVSTNRRETKTTKTLTTVMGGFIACWLPFFCYYLLIPFLPRKAVSEGLMYLLTWVGWINCAINPFIYAFYNPDFRTAFWRLTFRKICRRPSNHLTVFKG